MADKKVFVAGPEGRKPTREEAEAMAAALFEQIAANQQKKRDTPPK